jgi:hypothetical protein
LRSLCHAALGDVLIDSVAADAFAVLQQRHAGDLHVNERAVAAATPARGAHDFARSRSLAEPQRFAMEFIGRQQQIELGAQNFVLAILEEFLERGIAHLNTMVYVEDDHGLGMTREQ